MVESIDEIQGVEKKQAEALREAGYQKPRDLRKAPRAALAKIEGVGDELATRIKRQAGTSGSDDPRRAVSASLASPDDWQITDREATYLAERADLDSSDLVGESAASIAERIDWKIDPWFLGYQRVCGVVKRENPETGELEPVPHATVHVEDSDCSFLGFFPDEPPWGWLWPYDCHREVIATVRTNACGEFCVYIPRWEIDRILRFRRERYCLPELIKPTLEDLLRDPRIIPEPPWPNPRPDPGPLQFDRPQLFERIRDVVGEAVAHDLAAETRPTFGDRKSGGAAMLDRPAFVEPMPVPLPSSMEEAPELEAVRSEQQHLKTHQTFSPVEPDGFIGPYLPCRDVYVPEFVTVTDVPDVTFRVTQDVDGDGDEEVIYDEGFFDVRWDEDSIPDVTLIADGSAVSVPTCDVPDIREGECGELRFLTAGLMSVESPYHDTDNGYAFRPNRPKIDDGAGGTTRNDTKTPYTGVIQFHGCVRVEGAEYYRVNYAYEGNDPVTFTDLSWYVPRIDPGAGHWHMSPDADGWYEIPPKDELVFPYWVLNWPTHRNANGTYELSLEVADGSKTPLPNGESDPIAFTVDNSQPRVDYSVEWSTDESIWHRLTDPCEPIKRGASDTVHLRTTYTASARHFRNVTVKAHGCLADPTRSGDAEDFGHWYTDPDTDNSYTATAKFEIPSTHPDGTYSIRFNAHGRAFNPSGGHGGPSDDWYYDHPYVHAHPTRHFAITTV